MSGCLYVKHTENKVTIIILFKRSKSKVIIIGPAQTIHKKIISFVVRCSHKKVMLILKC